MAGAERRKAVLRLVDYEGLDLMIAILRYIASVECTRQVGRRVGVAAWVLGSTVTKGPSVCATASARTCAAGLGALFLDLDARL